MMAPRWRKVAGDMLVRPGRSLLVMVVLAAGVFEIGALLYKFALMQPVLNGMYGETRPASAILTTDGTSDALLDSVRRVPGVGDAVVRPAVMARVRHGDGEWIPALLQVTRDFEHQRMDLFTSDRGAWPPGPGDVLLERTALQVAGVRIGDSLTVRTPDGVERVLRVAGTAYAPGMAPAWMEHMVPGFVSWDSPLHAQGAGSLEELRIRVADHPLEEGHVREVADSVKTFLERRGHVVTRTFVPTPGRHPHADQMDAFLFLLAAFGVVGFILSSMLVANIMNSLLAEQVRQIGILKAIGASTWQVAQMYLVQVGCYAVLSLLLGMPLAIAVGGAYARFSGEILNADVSHAAFPWWAVVVIAAAGMLVPLMFSLIPVLKAARLPVREALEGDLGAQPFGSRALDRFWTRLAWLPRPLAIIVRTVFMRRGRLALTVIALALGGAALMSAINLREAWLGGVREDFARRHFDITAVFSEPMDIARLEAILAPLREVERAEYWPETSGYLLGADGVPGGLVSVIGPRPQSLLDLRVTAGRALAPSDSVGAVINQAVVARQPRLGVGDSVRVRIKGRTVSAPVVGIVKEIAPMPTIYFPPAAVLAATERDGQSSRTARIVTRRHDDAGQRAAAASLEAAFGAAGIEVTGMHRMLDMQQGILDHLVIILSAITFATVLVVVVGTLGLTSTLALNVVQRTREIGVLSAIGASARTIAFHVWFEAMLIGIMSWCVANVLAVPITWALETSCGQIFLKAPLDFSMSGNASLLWLGIVVVLATLGSIQPALRASSFTVKEALSHA